MIGFYPGSFDPITLGHEDIIRRALKICEKLVIGISKDNFKNSYLSCEQRLKLIKLIYSSNKNIEVIIYQGLTTEFAKEINANFIFKGLRNMNDYLVESQMAQLNRVICNEIDTIFLDSSDNYRSISSSYVKQIFQLDGDISQFVSSETIKFLEDVK
jgi:pantetheine-phosphate adenylyltransferase